MRASDGGARVRATSHEGDGWRGRRCWAADESQGSEAIVGEGMYLSFCVGVRHGEDRLMIGAGILRGGAREHGQSRIFLRWSDGTRGTAREGAPGIAREAGRWTHVRMSHQKVSVRCYD